MTAYKQITHWSWLQGREIVNQIYCPPNLKVSIEDFAAELTRQVQENELPVEVEICQINWVDRKKQQTQILIRRVSNNSLYNMVWFLVGIEHEGRFTFIKEEIGLKPLEIPKITISPLPKRPREIKHEPIIQNKWKTVIPVVAFGIMFLASAFLAEAPLPWFVLGIVSLIVAGVVVKFSPDPPDPASVARERQDVEEWNRLAEQEKLARDKAVLAQKEAKTAQDKAVKAWYSDALQATRLAETDDVLGRFTSSVSTTIKQVIKTLFEDHQAELRERTEKERTQQEIEAELEKRKQEGFQ